MLRRRGRGHGDGAPGLQIGRREGEAQGVAEHPDRDDEHEELVGEHGAVELGRRTGSGTCAGPGAGEATATGTPRSPMARNEPSRSRRNSLRRSGHALLIRGYSAWLMLRASDVEVEHQVRAGLVEADRGRALEDAEHHRVGSHVGQRQRVVDRERRALPQRASQERRRGSRHRERAAVPADDEPAEDRTERTGGGERDHRGLRAASGAEQRGRRDEEERFLDER